MRIVFLAHDYVMYGASRSLLNLLVEFKQRLGVEIKVFCPRSGDFTEALSTNEIAYEIYPFFNATHVAQGFSWGKSIERQIRNVAIYHKLKNAVKNFRPDIIHSNSSILHIGAYIAYDLKIPHVWHIREFGLKDYNMKFDLGNANFKKWLNRSAAIIAISKSIQKEVLGDISAPIYQIYNGVFSPSDIQSLSNDRSNRFVFCLVGGLYEKKQQHQAILAFLENYQEMPNAQLWLVGQGDPQYEKKLRVIAKNHPSIRFLGYVEKPLDIINQSDVGLICSEYEAMGRVTVEYMACGLPVIGYNQAGTTELIEHGVNGFLYQTTDELSEYMLELYENNALREGLGENARNTALSAFTQEVYANQVYEVMKSVL